MVNNDAWACVDIGNYISIPGTQNNAIGTGKLGDELRVFAWNDINCDNVFQPKGGETKLFSQATGIGNASDVMNGKTYALADSITGTGPITGGALEDQSKTHCIGLSWCAGTMTVDLATGTILCDGTTMGNETQGDSISADVAFRVVQSRNNPNFKCSVFDYVDIGNTTSEAGHNISTADWSLPWVKPGWGGNYGGGSSDSSLRLLMGKGDSQGCADPAARPATFTMNAGAGYATRLTLEHLDGAVNDSFEVFINGISRGTYIATSAGGNEVWKTTTFTFPGVTGVMNIELYATHPVTSWCADWGQVAFSNAKLE